ncbi:MAG: hypothetical protein ACF8XB_09540 [Planctomycetota bacterium JB042]
MSVSYVVGRNTILVPPDTACGWREGEPLTLILEFDVERTPPMDLVVGSGWPLRRVAYSVWEAAAPDPAHVLRDGPVEVRWISPAERVRLSKAYYESRDLSVAKAGADIVKMYDDAMTDLHRDPNKLEKSLWYSIDLATSFVSIAGHHKDVETRTGAPSRLLSKIDPARAEGLRWVLNARWQERAVTYAGGLSPDVYLAPLGGFRPVAMDVARLLLAVLRKVFPKNGSFDLEKVWFAALLFSSGNLRTGSGNPKLNLEPNSAALACMAELMDVAANRRLSPGSMALECANLRVVFASMLEPFFEAYRSSGRHPRRADKYVRTNLPHPIGPRDPRWSEERLRNLMKDYRRALGTTPKQAEERFPILWRRWGHTLADGLRDEVRVRRAKGW